MKSKIAYARIAKNKKQLCWDWSGSVTNLKKTLQEKCEVVECYFYWDWKMKLLKVLQKFHFKSHDFGIFNLTHANERMSWDKYNHIPIIQFEEFPYIDGLHSYIYQDLSAVYLSEIAKNDRLRFEYSGFGYLTFDALAKREGLQREFYSKALGVFVMSHWLYEYLLVNSIVPKNKLVYVGGGINLDPKRIDYSKKSGDKILFVGKDFIRKGGDLVYEAFCTLNEKMSVKAELYIVGPKEIPVQINNPHIHFVGEKTSEEVVHYFNMCDIFVMPSRFEAYGLVFIEALTFGLPCIGRNIQEMSYFIEDGKTGYLIEDDDSDILAQKMKLLLHNSLIKENVLSNKEEYLRKYSWEAVCDRMLAYIEKTEERSFLEVKRVK